MKFIFPVLLLFSSCVSSHEWEVWSDTGVVICKRMSPVAFMDCDDGYYYPRESINRYRQQ
jgi:hypothetical protein